MSLAAFWWSWSLDPALWLALLAAACWYGWGVMRLWRRAGVGRGLKRWRAACWYAGLAVLLVALLSPLDTLAELLFSAHMFQHLLLLLVAPPLLVLGLPGYVLLWALPLGWRRGLGRWWKGASLRGVWRVLSHPLTSWLLYTMVLWLWHVPSFYGAALAHPLLHALEHLSFLAAAGLFWWTVLSPWQHRLGHGGAVLYLFATSLQSSTLGALITLAPTVIYPDHAQALGWLTPLADQQLAGLLMWVPSGTLFILLDAVLILWWLRDMELDMRRRERGSTPLTPGGS